MEKESEWMVEIDNVVKSKESSAIMEMEKWKKHCIYEIPSCIADLNKRAYNPQTVSFGPYHYGKEHLMSMEEHKHRALIHFLKRCGKPLETLLQMMGEVEQDLRDSYKPLRWKEEFGNNNNNNNNNNNKKGFLKIMILDGCFILEILRTSSCNNCDYADNDPVFSDHGRLYVMPYIKRDMLMLENQLPMIVLDKLIEFEGSKVQNEESLNKLILKFLSPSTSLVRRYGRCFHILDLYRRSLLQHDPSHPTIIPKPSKLDKQQQGYNITCSARDLLEAGIWFKRSTTQSLKDVSFNNGILRLPSIVIDDCTETTFYNLIAFERLHVGAGNEVSSYLFFMDSVIDGEMDVAILHQKGIILNAIGSDKDVAKLFNSFTRDLAVDREGGLEDVQVSVCRYYKKPWNRWRANLIQTYFRNPWAIVSLVAAIVLFVLTIIQTVYSVKQS